MKKYFSEFGETPNSKAEDNAERRFTKEDLLYLAGFIDGEGCIAMGLKRSHNKYISYQVRLTVTNTNKYVLDWCKSVFGGYVYSRNKQETHHKDKYEWVLHGLGLDNLLKQLIGYLKIKKSECNLAILMRDTFPAGYGCLNIVNIKRNNIFKIYKQLRNKELRVTTEREALDLIKMKPQSGLM